MGEPAAGPLLALAARLGGVDPSAVEGLASLILDQPRGTPDPARSALNSNGDPLQLVISASTDGADIRLLADPAADAPEPRARRARARAATLRALEAVGAPAEPVLRMLAHLLPRDPYDGRDPGIGEQWLGVPVSARGLAVYVNAGWGGTRRYE